jgi:hypothetical protein
MIKKREGNVDIGEERMDKVIFIYGYEKYFF